MRPGDWVTVSLSITLPKAQRDRFGRFVGIVYSIYPPNAVVHLVDDTDGFTINEVVVPLSDLVRVNDRNLIPRRRLLTYKPSWIPRAARIKPIVLSSIKNLNDANV